MNLNMIYWDHYYNTIILLNLLIAVGLFTSLRLFSGTIAHINASDELLKRDNPAFGISLAGATFAITIMLGSLVYGSPENDVSYSVLSVGLYGVLGIVLMAVTRIIFDKITLPRLHLRDEILNGNKAVAIADAGNVLAAGIIIRAVTIWVDTTSTQGIAALVSAYAVSQLILTTTTLARIKFFEIMHKGRDLQDELRKGNIALALKFAGGKIGTAFAVSLAAQIVVYEEYDLLPIIGTWFFASLGVVLIWKVLTLVAQRIILFGVNINHEIVDQRNIAIGALTAVIAISMGVLISGL